MPETVFAWTRDAAARDSADPFDHADREQAAVPYRSQCPSTGSIHLIELPSSSS